MRDDLRPPGKKWQPGFGGEPAANGKWEHKHVCRAERLVRAGRERVNRGRAPGAPTLR